MALDDRPRPRHGDRGADRRSARRLRARQRSPRRARRPIRLPDGDGRRGHQRRAGVGPRCGSTTSGRARASSISWATAYGAPSPSSFRRHPRPGRTRVGRLSRPRHRVRRITTDIVDAQDFSAPPLATVQCHGGSDGAHGTGSPITPSTDGMRRHRQHRHTIRVGTRGRNVTQQAVQRGLVCAVVAGVVFASCSSGSDSSTTEHRGGRTKVRGSTGDRRSDRCPG